MSDHDALAAATRHLVDARDGLDFASLFAIDAWGVRSPRAQLMSDYQRRCALGLAAAREALARDPEHDLSVLEVLAADRIFDYLATDLATAPGGGVRTVLRLATAGR